MEEIKNFIQKKAVKEKLREDNFNCGSDVVEGLNKVVNDYLEKAEARAEGNGRVTVQGRDL